MFVFSLDRAHRDLHSFPTRRSSDLPAAVGVDIGCGMMAVQTSLTANDLPDDLAPLRLAIEKNVPHGLTPKKEGQDQGSWQHAPAIVDQYWQQLLPGFEKLTEKYPCFLKTNNYNHLGTDRKSVV